MNENALLGANLCRKCGFPAYSHLAYNDSDVSPSCGLFKRMRCRICLDDVREGEEYGHTYDHHGVWRTYELKLNVKIRQSTIEMSEDTPHYLCNECSMWGLMNGTLKPEVVFRGILQRGTSKAIRDKIKREHLQAPRLRCRYGAWRYQTQPNAPYQGGG